MSRPPVSSATYPEWAAWMRQQGYSQVTINTYQSTVRWWKRSRLSMDEWLAHQNAESQQRGGPPTESARIYRRALVAWARWRGEPAPAPLPRVIRLARPRPAAILTLEDVIRIDAEIAQLPPLYATVLGLLRATGLRVSEATRAQLTGVRKVGACVVLDVKAKTTSVHVGTRSVIIPRAFQPQLVAYLRGWRAGQGTSPWLFPSPKGPRSKGAVDAGTIGQTCKAIGERLDLRLHPHAFRHRFATELVEAGVEMRLIAAALGHRVADITARYSHPSLEAIAEAVERAAADQERQRARLR